jgi:hypothetical protein
VLGFDLVMAVLGQSGRDEQPSKEDERDFVPM